MLSWTEGISFKEIMDNFSHVREGNIVRSIIRTHELLKSMSVAACITGQVELKKKFSEAAALLKRDIAFAASLYIS